MKTGLRPMYSDNGPHTRGPTQYPTTNIEIVRDPTSGLKVNCCSSSVMMPVGMDDANVLYDFISASRAHEGKMCTHAFNKRMAASIVTYQR